MTTHYDVLQVPSTATYETIKVAYQTAARKLHPDKRQSSTSQDSFLQLQKAWECLRDDRLRKEYDLQLSRQHHQSRNSLPLTPQEFELVEEEGTGDLFYVYPCRCGQEVCLSESEFEQERSAGTVGGGPITCDGCSLKYHLASKES